MKFVAITNFSFNVPIFRCSNVIGQTSILLNIGTVFNTLMEINDSLSLEPINQMLCFLP